MAEKKTPGTAATKPNAAESRKAATPSKKTAASPANAKPPARQAVPAPQGKPMVIDFSEALKKAVEQSGLPAMDPAKIFAAHKKQMAALGEANYHALETLRKIINLQANIFQETLEAGAKATMQLQDPSSDKNAVGEAFMQDVLDRALNSMRVLSENVAKSNAEAIQRANDHMAQTIRDINKLSENLKK